MIFQFFILSSLFVLDYLSIFGSNATGGDCENERSFESVISNLDFIESSRVKIWNVTEQQNFQLILGRDIYSNFSHSKNQELMQLYGESILSSIPINIATNFKAGFRNIGERNEFHSFRHKFLENKCLNIVVIGGSVTSYITMNGKLSLGTESQTWPQKLENLLNYRYPNCTMSYSDDPDPVSNGIARHTVNNLAERAANSAFFCRRVMKWRGDSQHVIHFADLIIIDEVRNDDSLNAQYYEELLSILLKNSSYMTSPPALLWLGLTGWGRVLRKQVNLTRIHGFPMFHIPDTFIKDPYNLTDEMEDAMNAIELEGLEDNVQNQFHEFFIKRVYKGDVHGHLTDFAHSIIASFTLPVIEHLSFFCAFKSQNNSLLDKDVAVSNSDILPAFISKRVVDIFLTANPFLVSANNVHAKGLFKALKGFEVAADQPGRPVGLLGHSVGDMLMLVVPDRVMADHLIFGFLTISYLGSYESMGVVEVAIAPRETSSSSAVLLRNITYHRIDSLWNKSISVVDSIDIAVVKEDYYRSSDGSRYYYSMEINVTIIEAAPARSRNKFKILDFTLY